jgi:hypothetical protein
LRSTLSRRQLQALVGLPIERSIQLSIFGFEASVLGDASQHLWANLIFIVKGEDHIRPTGTGEDLVRAGFTFDTPADTQERGENAPSFR